jgi:hypothetical protein
LPPKRLPNDGAGLGAAGTIAGAGARFAPFFLAAFLVAAFLGAAFFFAFLLAFLADLFATATPLRLLAAARFAFFELFAFAFFRFFAMVSIPWIGLTIQPTPRRQTG